jgi:N-acetylmuramoyl-L-alanine amidase CwlA
MTYDPPSPPYLGPAAHTSEGSNKPIRRIVIHSTVSACVPGGARATAAYFRSEAARGSAHYVVDPAEVVQVVYDGVIAWHAPPNPNSLGVELCDMPTTASKVRWRDDNHRRMLELAAQLVAQLCLAYGVPPRYRGPGALRQGKHGITTHNDVRLAFGQTDHWDPGAWPRRRFMRKVRRNVRKLRRNPQ